MKRILITGGSGLVGSNLIKKFQNKFIVRATLHEKNAAVKTKDVEYVRGDLRDADFCKKVCAGVDLVVMAAANTSGAAVIVKSPLVHVTPNVLMNTLMLDAAYSSGVEKFCFISSNTVYPPSSDLMREEDVTNEFFFKYFCVAWMKRFSEILCEMYSTKIQNPMITIVLRPVNLYGEHDDFEWETSHMVPAFIRRAVEKHDPFEVWGTGKDQRDLLYIGDFVEAVGLALDKVNHFTELNIGSGNSVSVKQILAHIFAITTYQPEIKFNTSKPITIQNRRLDISKAKALLDFESRVPLKEGLKRTIEWYSENAKK